MEPPRSINVWVSVKFRDDDGNELQLDAEEVAVTNGDNLVQLVQATIEQLNDVLPPDSDRVVVSKFVSTSLDKFYVRIRVSKRVRETCEENGLYRVELLRPGDNDQQFYTLPVHQFDNAPRPKRRHSTSHAQSERPERAESSKKAKMELEEVAHAVNELDEPDLSLLVTKIEASEKAQPEQSGVSQDGEAPIADESGSTVGDDNPGFGQEENADSLPSDARQTDDAESSVDVDVDPEDDEMVHAEGQLVAAPPSAKKLSRQELREAANKIRVRSLGRYGRYGYGRTKQFRVTCPVCEDTFPTQAGYVDGVKHLIEAHLENYLDCVPYKCYIGNCTFGAFDERSMSIHLGKAHQLTRKDTRPTGACYNQRGRLLFIELLDLVRNPKK